MSFLSKDEKDLLKAAATGGNQYAKTLRKRDEDNTYNSNYLSYDGREKRRFLRTGMDFTLFGVGVLFFLLLLSLIWGAVDMGSSVTEGIHEFTGGNLTGWEVGFGPFYFQSWVTPYNDMPYGIKGDPGLTFMNCIALVGYMCLLWGLVNLSQYFTYDSSHYTFEQIQDEGEAIRKAAITANILQEMEPLLYNNTQLKF